MAKVATGVEVSRSASGRLVLEFTGQSGRNLYRVPITDEAAQAIPGVLKLYTLAEKAEFQDWLEEEGKNGK